MATGSRGVVQQLWEKSQHCTHTCMVMAKWRERHGLERRIPDHWMDALDEIALDYVMDGEEIPMPVALAKQIINLFLDTEASS